MVKDTEARPPSLEERDRGRGRMVILGGGESGLGAALLAKQQGYEVFLSDESSLKDVYRNELQTAEIEFEEGRHTEEKILNADEVMKSPGIAEKNELVKKIRAKGIEIISEIELAYRFKSNSRIIAVTGSNGKTTTTALTHHICQTAGLNCAMVGNIGYSFARQVVVNPKPLYVAEISSFQLDDIKTFRPDVAILTNITEDHLDRYEYNFENYIRSKFRITMNQTGDDYFIYNADDEITMKYLNQFEIKSNKLPVTMRNEVPNGAFIKDGDMYVRTGTDFVAMSVFDFALKGKHNQYNTMAACLAATTMEIRKDKIREAGATLLGGHTVKDPELKYGLSVTGLIHPDKILRNSTCQPGDRIGGNRSDGFTSFLHMIGSPADGYILLWHIGPLVEPIRPRE